MAAFLIDLDGTILRAGTDDLLPGALDALKKIKADGHWLGITTQRGYNFPPLHRYHIVQSERLLRTIEEQIGSRFDAVLWDVPSPRVVVNDSGAVAINLATDEGLTVARVVAAVDPVVLVGQCKIGEVERPRS